LNQCEQKFWPQYNINLAQQAIDIGLNLESSSGLLKFNEINKMQLPMKIIDPACYPIVTRTCGSYNFPASNELEITSKNIYFTDIVM
jgi:hypothetical protein